MCGEGSGLKRIKFWQALGHHIKRSLNVYYDGNITVIIDIGMNIEHIVSEYTINTV